MIKQSLIDEDSSTCFYQDTMLSVPKSCEYIPLEDEDVREVINQSLDKVNEFRSLIRDSIMRKTDQINEISKQFESLKEKVKAASILLDGKNISRAKMLLKVDCEFLRRSLPLKDISGLKKSNKSMYMESVDALKLVSLAKQKP